MVLAHWNLGLGEHDVLNVLKMGGKQRTKRKYKKQTAQRFDRKVLCISHTQTKLQSIFDDQTALATTQKDSANILIIILVIDVLIIC